MSTPVTPGSTIPEVLAPACPHCKKPLPGLGLYAYTVTGFAILNLYCPHCRAALHFQIMQRPLQEGDEPRVQIPS